VELLRVNTFIPNMVIAGGQELPRLKHISELDQQEGYTLGADGDLPSVLRIRHDNASTIIISGSTPTATETPFFTSTPNSTPTATETPSFTFTPNPTHTNTHSPTVTPVPSNYLYLPQVQRSP
jgi:hypothetical protein